MIVSRAWLQKYFEQELPSAKELGELFTFHTFEVEEVHQGSTDATIKVDVLPNRSSDCLCHRGIARELGTLLERPLLKDPLREPLPAYPTPNLFEVQVEDETFCPRYIGAVVRGVRVGESPVWLKEALESVGQRSINNIVDATNYVMLDLGQPLHAFDFHKLSVNKENERIIAVRSAVENEQITLLGGEERTLQTGYMLISDGVSDTPLAIAGIKGGVQAEITPDTTDIVLESAHFNAQSVRKTSQALKLATDASLRFQNEPVVELPIFAMRDVIDLVIKVAGGECIGLYDTYHDVRERTPIDVPLFRVNALLGTELSVTDVEKILIRLEWEFSRDGEEFAVTPTWERTDINLIADVIEEIGRIYGLRTIQSRVPTPLNNTPEVSKTQYYGDLIRRELTSRGYSEVLTYTLQESGEVELQNPLASDKSHLRPSLRPGLEKTLAENKQSAPLLGLDTVKVFELGTCFTQEHEELHLGIGVLELRGKQSKAEQQLSEDVQALGKRLSAPLVAEVRQGVAELRLDTIYAELSTPTSYDEPLPWNTTVRFTPWSVYPYVLRDIAVWVPSGVLAEEVLAVIITTAPDLLVRHDQFDSFEKEGRVSYAWHLVFQAKDRTLTDTEINTCMADVVSALQARAGWEVR
jgi:phenylalanyl-tRNA synthetase beta chain